MRKYMIIILSLAFFQLGISQDRTKAMEKIEAQKVAFFTKQLDLSPEESQAFWPVYNKYQEQFRSLREGRRPIRKKDGISDEEARELINKFFVTEEKELQLKRQMYADLDGILSPKKMVRLHFAEQQFRQKLLDRVKQRKDKRKPRR